MPLCRVNKKLLPMKIHYFLGIGGFAPFIPFLATIAKQRGYSSLVVGVMLMMLPVPGMIIKPAMGAITDKYKCRRSVFIGSTVIVFLLSCLLFSIPGSTSNVELSDSDTIRSPLFWLFTATIAFINAASSVRTFLENTICTELLGENKHDFGKQRLWGSIGWSLCAFVTGACVDWFSQGQNFKNYTPGYVISMISFCLDIYVVTKIKVVQSSNTQQDVISDVKKTLFKGKVLAFLIWVLLFGFFMTFIWYFVFWYLEDLANLYHPEIIPLMKTLQGIDLLIQCVFGEVPSFFLSSYLLQRVNQMTIFSTMFFTFFTIFTAYSLIENPLWAIPVEVLNGLVFGLPYSAAVSYAALIAPVGTEGTLQAIVVTVLYEIGSPIGGIIGGNMFKNLGSIKSFRILSVAAFVTCFTQIVVNQAMNRFPKNNDVKDDSKNVSTKENDGELTKIDL